MIRARQRRHLENLKRRFPDDLGPLQVTYNPEADYLYRVIVSKKAWARLAAELATEQDWSNFKSEVENFLGPDHHD
jgi:hypothetical protein